MVWFTPSFLATRQERMFSSSLEVVAIKSSAFSASASFCTL